jgi:hypothetical protein
MQWPTFTIFSAIHHLSVLKWLTLKTVGETSGKSTTPSLNPEKVDSFHKVSPFRTAKLYLYHPWTSPTIIESLPLQGKKNKRY